MNLKDIKEKVQEGKAIIGAERVLKGLQAKKISHVYTATNCPSEVRKSVERYALLSSAEVVPVPQTNQELGILCKKNFAVAVVGLVRD